MRLSSLVRSTRFFDVRKVLIISFFLGLISLGSVLLSFPFAWQESVPPLVDVIFMAVSAVCITGLTTVSVTEMSDIGQRILLMLIQIGGLGIISFTTIYFLVYNRRLPSIQDQMIKEYFLDELEYSPQRILFNIIVATLIIELAGSFLLYGLFRFYGEQHSYFYTLFHTISAFCNAGFSLEPDGLFSWTSAPWALVAMSLLIVLGGLGFVVVQDLFYFVTRRKRALNVHSRIVLSTTAILLVLGMVIFPLLEAILAPNNWSISRFLNAVFYMINTRTAGFSILDTQVISEPGRLLGMFYMFIGVGPSSTGGGIKVTVLAILVLSLFRGYQINGLQLKGYSLSNQTVYQAFSLCVKAFFVVFLFGLILFATENYLGKPFTLSEILFEAFSAMGTVGLSTGITPLFSPFGKIVLIVAMILGRVGLLAITLSVFSFPRVTGYRAAKAHILLG